jgi:RsiW-degrading membrane proteinase PrsW (M82 family)
LADGLLTLVGLALAPTVFLFSFVYMRDRYEHEPLRLVILTFFIGSVMVLPAIFLEQVLALPIPAFVQAYVVIALVEEGLKFVAVRIKPYRSREFNEVMDGIVYGATASLGFATVENLLYVLGPHGGAVTGIFRAFLSVPGHVAYAGIMGFYLGLAKPFRNTSKSQERSLMVKGLVIAVFLHGSYDALLSLGGAGFFGAILVDVVSWIVFLRLIKKALSMSPFRWGAKAVQVSRFCSNCGVRLEGGGSFCIECGTRVSQ